MDLVLINVNGFLALVEEVLDDERLLPGIEPAKAFGGLMKNREKAQLPLRGGERANASANWPMLWDDKSQHTSLANW